MTLYLSRYFPDILNCSPNTPDDSNARSFITFHGNGYDPNYKDFKFEGRVYPVQWEAAKVPGFQRLVMLQYFDPMAPAGTFDTCWCWETCVLPGGNIMIGRYFWGQPWADQNGEDCGPIIMWQIFPRQIASATLDKW